MQNTVKLAFPKAKHVPYRNKDAYVKTRAAAAVDTKAEKENMGVPIEQQLHKTIEIFV